MNKITPAQARKIAVQSGDAECEKWDGSISGEHSGGPLRIKVTRCSKPDCTFCHDDVYIETLGEYDIFCCHPYGGKHFHLDEKKSVPKDCPLHDRDTVIGLNDGKTETELMMEDDK